MKRWKIWATVVVVLTVSTIALVAYATRTAPVPGAAVARAQEPARDETTSSSTVSVATVDVIHPGKGMDLEVEQPGSVRSFEAVQLQAKVSGFLKKQDVDIGDRVKRGQILAVIDVPELEKQLKHNNAALKRGEAQVAQMEARVVSARADRDAAQAAVEQADAAYKSAEAWVRYRQRVYQRMKDLYASTSIEEKLVDEAKEKFEASLETDRAAKAAIATSQANLAAAIAKISQAEADVLGARCEVHVAQADVERTQVLLDYAKIPAPFDGEITRRNFFVGDFIRSAGDGTQVPILTVHRTDKFRVVVQVPDSCVPYLDAGDPAVVYIDSLPGKQFVGKVSRKSGSEDPSTRLMHVEIDLPNPTGEISDGMYGQVHILLDKFADKLSVPLGCLVNTKGGKGVYIVGNDGLAHLTAVRLGKDNGRVVVVVEGLHPDDAVVLNPATVSNGAEVHAQLVQPPARPER
jgi:RND family efflux transporter MFP subunit